MSIARSSFTLSNVRLIFETTSLGSPAIIRDAASRRLAMVISVASVSGSAIFGIGRMFTFG